jgi:hypothetical protein
MSAAPDRIPVLLSQSLVTGIDFIYVYPDQQRLDVYFLRKVTSLDVPMPGTITADDILIYSEETELPIIEIETFIGFTTINNQDVLQLKTKTVGDFTLYKFKIEDARLDPFFNDISFSFKANCPSDLDCAPPDHECPPDELVDFPVDYLARDFWSYRKALLDFASLRYPDWTDRLEADAGIMMAELMSAVGDEMAYYQDRVSREAYLETASQRRSIRKHARLIDYQMHDGLGAKTWIDVTVPAGIVLIDAGTGVFALSDDNNKIDFEIGEGIRDTSIYTVNAALNEFLPHLWDEDETCLLVGSTELYIVGHQAAVLTAGGLPKWVLLQTKPTDPAQTPRAQMVKLIEVTDTTDPVFNINITHLVWEPAQAIQFEMDLTILTVRGNMLPATAGLTHETVFIVDKPSLPILPEPGTINRNGHDNTNSYIFTLPNSQAQQLVFLGDDPHTFNLPEILLEEVEFIANAWVPKAIPQNWDYKNTLVGVVSSNPLAKDFTLDDGTWQKIVTYQRLGKTIEHHDYAMNAGVSIRFGDGEFGQIPSPNTAFKVKYRLGGTRRSNVAADTIVNSSVAGLAITNPLPATGGFDPETTSELRQLAPEAFRSLTYRAVRPEDYAEAAERLPWVQKAGAAFRWTGSWLTAFTTPDPKGKVVLEALERNDLTNQLNRFRQAGREVNVLDPIYANIDLKIEVCVAEDSYSGEVKERVLLALLGKTGIRPMEGYFSPDRFTFGTFLERSTLEAAIQAVPGVKAVEKITFRRRAWFGWREFAEMSYDPGINSIIRIANDPLHPERGTLNIYTHGGL